MKMITYKNRFVPNYNPDITAAEARKRRKLPGRGAKKKKVEEEVEVIMI